MGDIYNAMWKYDEALSTLEHNEFVKVTNYSKDYPKIYSKRKISFYEILIGML